MGTPNTAQTLGIWASASRQFVTTLNKDGTKDSHGHWVQVSRLGFPLINEAVIGLQDKDKYLRKEPSGDLAAFGGYFLNPVLVRDAKAIGVYDGNDALFNTVKTGRIDIVNVINLLNIPTAGAHADAQAISTIGDVLRIDVGVPSGFPNGRTLTDDVTDVELSLILLGSTSGISDGVDNNDVALRTSFPWLASPWEGATQGHGQVPPTL